MSRILWVQVGAVALLAAGVVAGCGGSSGSSDGGTTETAQTTTTATSERLTAAQWTEYETSRAALREANTAANATLKKCSNTSEFQNTTELQACVGDTFTELNTAAGSLSWIIQRAEDKPAPAQTPNELNLILREYAQDKKASVRLSFGSLDKTKNPSPPGGGDTWVALEIAPGGIEPTDGKVSGTAVFTLRIDKQGNSYVMQAKTRTEEIKGDLHQKVTGNVKQEIGGTLAVKTGGTVTEDFGGAHTAKGPSSDENWSGAKTITAAALKLGSAAAAEPVPLGNLLIQWLATHTHPASNTPPAQAGAVTALISGKVFVTK